MCHCKYCLAPGILLLVVICGWEQSWKIGRLPHASPPQQKSLVPRNGSSSFSPDTTPLLPRNPVLARSFQDLRLSASVAPGSLCGAGTAAAPVLQIRIIPCAAAGRSAGLALPGRLRQLRLCPKKPNPHSHHTPTPP